MAQNPFDELKKYDPEFSERLSALTAQGQEPDALDQKTRTLITMALMAVSGHPNAVKDLAGAARSLGTTEKEIQEILHLVFFNSGLPALVTGLAAFQK